MINEVIFDLETKSFFDETGDHDASKLGVSIVSLYKRVLNDSLKEQEGEILSFWEDELDKMWEIFENAQRIIGFNSLDFDVPALSPYSPANFPRLAHFDLLAKIKESIGKRASLDALAKETLGTTKIDSGKNAIIYWSRGDKESLAKLKKYCEADVIITKDIYDFGLANGFLKYKDYWNNLREVPVDFSYQNTEDSIQKSLF